MRRLYLAMMFAMPPARIAIRVHPRSHRTELAGYRDGILQVRVTAPATEGKANKAVCRLLAKELGVPPSNVTIVHGERSRTKMINVVGLDQPSAEGRLSKPTR
jgi:uncharacterized protein (TIGR00251 family)